MTTRNPCTDGIPGRCDQCQRQRCLTAGRCTVCADQMRRAVPTPFATTTENVPAAVPAQQRRRSILTRRAAAAAGVVVDLLMLEN